MTRSSRCTILLLLFLSAVVSFAQVEDDISLQDGKIHLQVMPYLVIPGMSGDVTVKGQTQSTVVNRLNARRPLDVYRFLRNEVQPYQMQFIPCVEQRDFCQIAPQKWDKQILPKFDVLEAHPGNPESVVTDWSVDPDEWGFFLCKIWDEWYRRDYGKVFVNLFETAVAQWMGVDALTCVYHEFCGKGIVLEHDGSVYSCDHYVYPEYKLGNILERSSSQMVFSERQMEFGLSKFSSLPQRCRSCKYLFACNGECPKNRLIRTPEGEFGLNYLCSGLLRFWEHIDRDMQEIRGRIALGNSHMR